MKIKLIFFFKFNYYIIYHQINNPKSKNTNDDINILKELAFIIDFTCKKESSQMINRCCAKLSSISTICLI